MTAGSAGEPRARYATYPELQGRNVVLVGSGPLADAIAGAFIQNEAHVTQITPAGESTHLPGVVAIPADLADPASLLAAVSAFVAARASVHLLVACVDDDPAARGIADIADATWRRSLDGTLGSAFRAARALIPVMVAGGGGRIVFVSSQLALNPPWPSSASYAAANGGLLGLARHIAKEFGRQGIRANAVAPGIGAREWAEIVGTEYEEGALEAIPVGRLPEPEEPAALILYLASDGASYVNGATLQCSGGRGM